jgi:hypothetical protein
MSNHIVGDSSKQEPRRDPLIVIKRVFIWETEVPFNDQYFSEDFEFSAQAVEFERSKSLTDALDDMIGQRPIGDEIKMVTEITVLPNG